jgi:hypothetical protein
MKISIDVDCTPEEARTFMGLPDLSMIHAQYIEKMKQAMDDGLTGEKLAALVQSWAPMGESGMNLWRQFIDQMNRGATKS